MSSVLEVPSPRKRQAQARALEKAADITTAVESLVETLGKGLVAVILERHVRTVTRWLAGEGSPDDAEQKRIIDTLQIVQLLLSGDSPSVVRAWFMGMNPQLDDESPAELLAEGRARDVLARPHQQPGVAHPAHELGLVPGRGRAAVHLQRQQVAGRADSLL
jgi:hypothetical protein